MKEEEVEKSEENNLPSVSTTSSAMEGSDCRTKQDKNGDEMDSNIIPELVTSDLGKPKLPILPELIGLNAIKEPPPETKDLVAQIELRMDTEAPMSANSTTIRTQYPVRSKINLSNDCAKCDFSSKSVYQLRDHYSRVHSEELFLCEECGKMFHYKGNLKDHKRFYHSNSNESLKCCHCDFTTNDRRQLTSHLNKTHYNSETLTCTDCGFKTRYKKSMTSHQLSKHSKKVAECFICNVCNKQFVYQSSLEKHKRTHTNERPFSCDSCPYKAFRLSTLRIHIERSHTNARPFQCRNCKLKFAEEVSLKLHLLVHMQYCSMCSKYKTTNKTDLRKHQKQCLR